MNQTQAYVSTLIAQNTVIEQQELNLGNQMCRETYMSELWMDHIVIILAIVLENPLTKTEGYIIFKEYGK